MSEETMNQNTEQKPTNSNPEDKNGDPGYEEAGEALRAKLSK